MNPSKPRSCDRKVRHGNRRAAQAAARRLAERGFRHGSVSVYRCLFCDGWHIGRAPKQRGGAA